MTPVNIIEKTFQFKNELNKRYYTRRFVIHHTGTGTIDLDASAEQIHDWHLENFAGIGYHFVVRKNGAIERGRPEWAVGSHAYGANNDSIGIHLSGEYELYYPTDAQIEATAMLLANLCERYEVPIDRNHIFGHFEVDPDGRCGTDCPGKNLFAKLPDIVGKAQFYHQKYAPDTIDNPANTPIIEIPSNFDADIKKINQLVRKYESTDNPAYIARQSDYIDSLNYGLYKFSIKTGSLESFVKWLCEYPDVALANYGKVLASHKIGNINFIKQWKELGTVDPGNFGRLQEEYLKTQYYDIAAKKLATKYFNINKHTDALKAVLFSRAVQNGASGCTELFELAVKKIGQPNLSYVDSDWFDKDMINAVYDYLIVECDLAVPDKKGNWRSPDNFCQGSKNTILSLRSRFVRERADALAML